MITDMISTAPGFQTSVNIAYDLNNSEKIKSLIPTSTALSLFEEFLLSTDNAATNRAKVLIGAYGKGKSHIILSLLSLLCKVVEIPETRKPDIEKNEQNIAALLSRVKEVNADLYEYAKDYLVSPKRLLPVIINGSNTSLVQSFMGALYNTLKSNQLMTLMPDTHFQAAINMIRRWEAEYPETLIRFKSTINMPLDEFVSHLANFDVEAYSSFEKIYPSLTAGSEFNPFAGFNVIELYEKVIEKLPEVGYTGIIVVYDEFSKYLESSITKASISDIKMLQDFAEKCNRSGAKQLHLLLISHKEIENYIDVLPKQKVDGWKGVSERFSHIRMHSDFSQIYEVISQAIIKQDDLWMDFCERNELRFEDLRQRFCNSKLFADCDETGKTAAFVGCYPLHPITTFMLPRISEKVAQNERTLFTFISGQEATTLSKVMERLPGDFPLITPDTLYDYFAPQMRKEVYTSEIHQLYRLTSSILAKFSPDTLHAKIIKTLSLIYCLGEFERLAPTVDTILSIYVDDEISAEHIENVLTDLVQKQCVVYLKRSNAYLKLKESSGVDVYQAIADLVQKRSNIMTVANLLNSANHEPYAYPIRYNDRREMTRFFQFVFVDSSEVLDASDYKSLVRQYDSDGVIFGILPRDDEQVTEIVDTLLKNSSGVKRAVFVVPEHVDDILVHLRNLDAVQILREASQGDDLLFDEYDVIYQDLSEVVLKFVTQYTHPEFHAAKYIHNGEHKPLHRKAHLSHLLSDICDEVYSKTPVINNEVLNKNRLTTVAMNSRTKLLNGLLTTPLQANLGLTGSGQDVSFMRSTLITTGMLQQDHDNTFITLCDLPEEHKNLQNVLAIIESFFTSTQTDGAKSFETLYHILTGTHDGISMRKGLIPIYIAAVLRKYQKNVVIRNQFSEVGISPALLNDINESPNDYSVKIEKWSDEKERYIDMLDELFADHIFEADKAKTGYSYLAIAMGRWYLSLPRYTKELKQVYTGYLADETYSEVDGKRRKFIALLKQPSIGALDLLFSRIPKCFDKEEASVELAREIASAKVFFDQIKPKLEDALTMDVKKIFCGDPYVEATLPSIVKDWYEGLTVAAKNKVYANTAERIFRVFENATNDEHLLIEGLARVLTSLRIDDWTDSNISAFREKMEMYKATIDAESSNTHSDTATAVEPIAADVSSGYAVVFVDENGKAMQRMFDRIERSKRSDVLYRKIESAIRDMGNSVSPQEKRQVLMEILEKLC